MDYYGIVALEVVHGVLLHWWPMSVIATLSIFAYRVAVKNIPHAAETLLQNGIYGIDINKTTVDQRKKIRECKQSTGHFPKEFKKVIIPESLGIFVGAVHLCTVICLILLCQIPFMLADGAITTCAIMLLLGFVDDVLNVRWRYKIVLSILGTIPLISLYQGSLSVMLPLQLRWLSSSRAIYLGPLYYLYMLLINVFCTNSINILAGVNGIEVGQSMIIAVSMVIYNILQMRLGDSVVIHHILSLALLVPFLAVSYALWKFNKYPSRVFIGDSYTYFAGTTLAVSAVCAVSSKTLILFFLPQLVNFIISVPQLFGVIPCPSHRVPRWDEKTDLLTNSKNYTILNLILWITGDMHERQLTRVFLWIQAISCLLGFLIRYGLASLVFEHVE